MQEVVGVTSFGDQNCAVFGVDTRTDVEADFLLANVDLCAAGADCTATDGGGCCSSSRGSGSAGLGLVIVAGRLLRRRRA